MKYLQTFLLIALSMALYSQPVRISVLINGKKVAEKTVRESPGILRVHASKFKNVSSLTLICKQQNAADVYKRAIDITDDTGTSLYNIRESKLKPGWYNMGITIARRIILKEKKIKVYLMEDPVNDMMALPSRRNLLIEIYFI